MKNSSTSAFRDKASNIWNIFLMHLKTSMLLLSLLSASLFLCLFILTLFFLNTSLMTNSLLFTQKCKHTAIYFPVQPLKVFKLFKIFKECYQFFPYRQKEIKHFSVFNSCRLPITLTIGEDLYCIAYYMYRYIIRIGHKYYRWAPIPSLSKWPINLLQT